jgi:hypothetical protein
MNDDALTRIAALERRLSLVEAFLDTELRERQHLAQLHSAGGAGPINPWHGCSLMPMVQPIDVGPIVSESPLGCYEIASRSSVIPASVVSLLRKPDRMKLQIARWGSAPHAEPVGMTLAR